MSVVRPLLTGLVFMVAFGVEPAHAATTTWREQGTLSVPSALTDDVGTCATATRDMAVLGASGTPLAGGGGVNAGAAHVFAPDATGKWTLTQTLAPSDLSADAWFGTSCAMTDDHLVVGARGASGPGVAYVYALTAGSWVFEQKLTASDPAPADSFGISVAIDTSTILVGAKGAGSAQQGAAYAFTRTASAWSGAQKLTASDAMVVNWFGSSVAVDGTTLAVGASLRSAVYVFSKVGATWLEHNILSGTDTVQNDGFGFSLALRGDTLVSGAARRNGRAGAAYVFGRTGGIWSERQKLEPPGLAADDEFGRSVALGDKVVFVGAPSRSQLRGSVFVFPSSATGWGPPAELPAPAMTGSFGRALGSASTTLVASVYGKAYVFRDSLARGASCSSAAECVTGFCADGVCCDGACGGSAPRDCEACTKALGASEDGVCGPAPPTQECQSTKSECDVPERCDGLSRACPSDGVRTNGASCIGGGVCVNGACSVDPAAATDAGVSDGALASPAPAPPSCGCHLSERASWPSRAVLFALVMAVACLARRTTSPWKR